MLHIYNGILLSHKKEWNTAICNNMDGPRDCHTKWSKSDKDKYLLYHFYAAKDGEALYSQQKQDQELTVAQTMNSLLLNSDLNWRKYGKPLDHSAMT